MKYPAIYQSTVNGNVILLFTEKEGVVLNTYYTIVGTSGGWNESAFKNITTEYLANTYGEVKSKGHAEFIKLLAETNGVPCAYKEVNYPYKFFYIIDGTLFFCPEEINTVGQYKQITIPLPSELNVNTPEEVICNSLNENGDNLIFGDADKCKEWPCVGDDVEAKHPSGQTLKGELLAITKEYAIIQQLGHEQHLILSAWELSKPKTPEEELRELLLLLWKENNHDFDMFLDVVTSHITKKPQ